MIKEIKNTMTTDTFEAMREKVIHMNTNIESFIYQEMLNHQTNYDTDTGLRKTKFTPQDDTVSYGCIPMVGTKGHKYGLEFVCATNTNVPCEKQRVIFYIHGAAFQRRSNDMFHNFETYYSMCEMAQVSWKNYIDFMKAS